MNMDITPTRDRVLVKRVDTRDVTAGGIIIPENAKEKANVGMVVAVGPGVKLDGARQPMLVKSGDKILFGKYAGTEFDHKGDTLLFLREDEILAILLDNVSVVS